MDVNVTDLVLEYLKTKDLKVKKEEERMLFLRFTIKGGTVDLYVQFDESGKHVHLQGINFIKVPEEKYTDIYPAINQANDTFKNVKFILKEQYGQIIAKDDGVIDLETCGEETFELIIVMIKVIQDAYPALMKAIWT